MESVPVFLLFNYLHYEDNNAVFNADFSGKCQYCIVPLWWYLEGMVQFFKLVNVINNAIYGIIIIMACP